MFGFKLLTFGGICCKDQLLNKPNWSLRWLCKNKSLLFPEILENEHISGNIFTLRTSREGHSWCPFLFLFFQWSLVCPPFSIVAAHFVLRCRTGSLMKLAAIRSHCSRRHLGANHRVNTALERLSSFSSSSFPNHIKRSNKVTLPGVRGQSHLSRWHSFRVILETNRSIASRLRHRDVTIQNVTQTELPQVWLKFVFDRPAWDLHKPHDDWKGRPNVILYPCTDGSGAGGPEQRPSARVNSGTSNQQWKFTWSTLTLRLGRGGER